MTPFDESIVEEFVIEAKEHLERVERDLLSLEKNKDALNYDKINEIFRGIHTIKGASGFLGFIKIGELSHIMETLLSMIRAKEIIPQAKHFDSLLKGIDLLKTMIDDTGSSNAMDISSSHSLLSSLINKKPIEATKKTNLIQVDGKVEKEFPLGDFDLKKMSKSSNFNYILEYDLVQLAKDNINPVALLKNLQGLGEIIDSRVNKTIINLQSGDLNSSIVTKILFSTILDPSMIEDGVGLKKDKITELKANQPITEKVIELETAPPQAEQVVATIQPETIKTESNDTNTGPTVEKTQNEAIRINVNILDRLMTLAGEMVLVRNQCMQAMENNSFEDIKNIFQNLNIVTTEMQESIMLTRMQPIGNVFNKLPRIARDLSKKLNKNIEMKTIGDEVEIDKNILQGLADPLIHLVRNCCDHAIESIEERIKLGKPSQGKITLHAYHDAGQINIEIEDDGRGINRNKIKQKAIANKIKTEAELEQMSDKDILSIIMLPGFSTAEKISDVSGRGVGMDVVRSSIQKLGGEIELNSVFGVGMKVKMRLPLTLAIIPCLIVGVNDNRYAIPQVSLDELVRFDNTEENGKIENAENQEVYRLRDRLLPIVRLSEIFQRPKKFSNETRFEIIKKYRNSSNEEIENKTKTTFAVVKAKGKHYGLVVDKVFGTEEIVVKPMHTEMKMHEIYSGATVMGDGKVALILNIEGISNHAGVKFNTDQKESKLTQQEDINNLQKVLLFKSGETEQFAIVMSLIRRIEKITTKDIENIGGKEFITIDDTSTEIIRLDNVFNVSECVSSDELMLLLPKTVNKPYGILMSKVVDIADTSMKLNTQSYMAKGLLGTSIINKHMTMFIDISNFNELSKPKILQ